MAWHERQISGHLEQLATVREQAGDARTNLEAVLRAYAGTLHALRATHASELAAHLNGAKHVALMRRRLLTWCAISSSTQPRMAQSGLMWRQRSWRAIHFTPSRPPVTSRRSRGFAAWCRSRWVGWRRHRMATCDRGVASGGLSSGWPRQELIHTPLHDGETGFRASQW